MPEQTHPEAGVVQEAPVDPVDRVAAIFEQSQDPAQGAGQQAEPEQSAEQAAEQSPAETEEVTPDDIPDDESEKQPAVDAFEVEIVHDGRQVKLNREDTIKYARQGFDYTQKTQQLAAERRQVGEHLQRLAQIDQVAPQLQQHLAEVAALGSQLQQYKDVNWIQVAQTDPNYHVLRAQFDQLRDSYNAAVQRYQRADAAVKGELQQVAAQRLQAEAQRLPELVPEWKDQAKFESAKQAISKHFVETYQIDPAELSAEANTAMKVAVLYKAMKYDQLVRSKADKSKALRKTPPVTVPGAANPQAAKADKEKQLRANLKKTGSMDDAVAVLLNRR